MPLNQSSIFPPSRELNVNFNWVDVSSGTGYVLFDGYASPLAAGTEYVLIPSTIADDVTSVATVGNGLTTTIDPAVSGVMAKRGEIDFDMSVFNIPQTVRGDVYVRAPSTGTISGAGTRTVKLIVKFRKWDGVTETDIASGETANQNFSSHVTFGQTVKIVVPRTLFKKGETLRITVEYWGQDVVGTFAYTAGHNPRDTAGGSFNVNESRLSAAIPFEVNI